MSAIIDGTSASSLSGTLTVTGATTLSSTLALTGTLTASSDIVMTGTNVGAKTLSIYNADTGSGSYVISYLQTNAGSVNLSFGSTAGGGAASFYSSGAGGMYLYTVGAQQMQFGTNSTERMRIDSSGNVGIGTASPAAPLDILSDSSANTIKLRGRSADNISSFRAYSNDGVTQYAVLRLASDETRLNSVTAIPLTFGTTNTERMRIDSSGNVGIGTASPTAKLEVSGAIKDSIGNVRAIPANAQGGAYTLVLTDAGKHIAISTGGVTVPASIFSAGDVVSIYNNSASNQTITQGATVTMYLVGTATTGNRTLAQRGVVTIICVASNTFVISGGGLT